ncbi:MAG: porin family protein [Dysgonomonas sp.]
MQNRDEDKYREQPDDFSKRIRQKIENHRMPVDSDCWSAIEAQIKKPAVSSSPTKSKRVALRWIGSAVAVAAIIALVFLIIPDNKPLSEMAVIHQDTNQPNTVSQPEQKAVDEIPAKIQVEKAMAVRVVQHGQNVSLPTENVAETNKENESDVKVTDSADSTDNNTTIANDEPVKNADEPKIEKESTSQRRDARQQTPILLGERKNKNDKWLVAASFSSGSGSVTDAESFSTLKDYASSDELQSQNPPTLKDPGEVNSRMLSDNDFTDSDHSLPLSFGLSIRKDINKYIGIETGLTYTYLSSTFERINIPQYKSKRELHYLGIPVNLVVYLWNDPKWNVYVSGGAMLEKGLQQKYVQDMYQNNVKISSTSDKGSISGVQWSLNAAAGVSYSFYQDLSLYAEPRFSHYFDNNQPASIRSEKSDIFSLGGGLRYKF